MLILKGCCLYYLIVNVGFTLFAFAVFFVAINLIYSSKSRHHMNTDLCMHKNCKLGEGFPRTIYAFMCL